MVCPGRATRVPVKRLPAHERSSRIYQGQDNSMSSSSQSLLDREFHDRSSGSDIDMPQENISLDTSLSRKRILAVASGGGHWVQLMRLIPAFNGHEVVYITTHGGYRSQVEPARFFLVRDANRWIKFRMLLTAIHVGLLVLYLKPDVVISTGAAPGYFAIRFGRWVGAKTIWIDSIANAEKLSMSGELAGKHAHLWLTQWPHLAKESGPQYMGAVL